MVICRVGQAWAMAEPAAAVAIRAPASTVSTAFFSGCVFLIILGFLLGNTGLKACNGRHLGTVGGAGQPGPWSRYDFKMRNRCNPPPTTQTPRWTRCSPRRMKAARMRIGGKDHRNDRARALPLYGNAASNRGHAMRAFNQLNANTNWRLGITAAKAALRRGTC